MGGASICWAGCRWSARQSWRKWAAFPTITTRPITFHFSLVSACGAEPVVDVQDSSLAWKQMKLLQLCGTNSGTNLSFIIDGWILNCILNFYFKKLVPVTAQKMLLQCQTSDWGTSPTLSGCFWVRGRSYHDPELCTSLWPVCANLMLVRFFFFKFSSKYILCSWLSVKAVSASLTCFSPFFFLPSDFCTDISCADVR